MAWRHLGGLRAALALARTNQITPWRKGKGERKRNEGKERPPVGQGQP